MIKLLYMIVATSVGLTACSSETPKINLMGGNIPGALTSVLKRKLKTPAPDPSGSVTRAQLKGIPGPVLFAHLEKTDAYASLSQSGENSGVKTFQTADNVSLSSRDGVILASRGLRGDLMSADISGTVDALVRPGPAEYPRIMRWLDGEDQMVTSIFQCSMEKAGHEKLTILGTRFSTTHLKERCRSGDTTFENDYWRDDKSPLLWQTHQWLGHQSGYINLQLWVK